MKSSPVGWRDALECTGCIFAERQDSPNKSPTFDTKQHDGEAPVMLELWGMQSTFSLRLLTSPVWSGVVAPDRVLSMGQIVVFDI